ncbi:nuclear pore complex NUP133 [Micractinium conductrix]|uniref:Nuclear pore complex NUP133 n=1 Tax=Micractinium conductrix TaxID=554055 RepID=A0A2P6V066_9CHLO|nr:nuclear pore complex NUP133 [Micractinium conductrix]|eukprot:PSC67487.1 nuclear pore complex NUP133 [Micractinium conductrix]
MATADHGDAFGALQAAINGQLSAPKLSQELSALGAYRHAGRSNPVAAFSAMVCDALPRSWPTAAVGEQLGEKQAAHGLLLQCLQDSGALGELHPSALRLLFQDGQQLAALAELRELLTKGGAAPLQAVVLAAGAAAAAAAVPAVAAAPEDAFFACPLKSVPLFLREVAAAAARLVAQPGRAAGDQAALAALTRAVQAALSGALHQRSHHQQWFSTAFKVAGAGYDGQPEWTAGEGVRAALAALAEAACRLHASLPAALRAENAQLVLELTDRLLNCWAAAAAAAAAALPSAQRAELRGAYANAKGRLLGWLLVQAQAQGLREPEGEHLLRRVEGLAEAHQASPQLYDIARATGDRDTLYRQMEQLEGEEGPFAHFVFGRLLNDGRAAELMDLPSQFDAALHAWLSDAAGEDAPARARLLWLHEIRCQEYGAVAGSLGALVAAQAAGLGEEEVERMLALKKLAALAAA